ncbi:MAG: pectinesterase family protein [Rikenellaceae bacterium]|nr:pectinesterase family protein [Rikenellaceae bacterium]
MKKTTLIILSMFLCLTGLFAAYPEVQSFIVAQDGSGDFTTIQEAVNSCKHFHYVPTEIHIKNGIYREKVEIPSWITGVRLIGEDKFETKIIYDDYSSKQVRDTVINTFTSYTLRILGDDTQFHNLTIENDTPMLGQAVALHVESGNVLVNNCRLIGNQDTFYANGRTSEIFVTDSYIEGTTDFIFGSAKLFIDNSVIHCKKNSYITAASTPEGRDLGFAIFNTDITADQSVDKMYLGRPWRIFAKTVFIDCAMGDFILPAGWHNWNKPEAESTVYYGEYGTTGNSTDNRVSWSRIMTRSEAEAYYNELRNMKNKYLPQ